MTEQVPVRWPNPSPVDAVHRITLDPAKFQGYANAHRTPGLHLTDIIRDIMLTMGVDRSAGSKFSQQQLGEFAIQGYLWEDAMTETLRGKCVESAGLALGMGDYVRLPEIAVSIDGSSAFFVDLDSPKPDGFPRGYILMSPDGMRLDPLRVLEIKWTTTSVNTPIKPEWWYQLLGYVKGVGLALNGPGGEPIRESEQHIQYAAGDYRGSGVTYERWFRRWSDEQVEDNWSLVAGHLLDRVAEGRRTGKPHEWEQYVAEAA